MTLAADLTPTAAPARRIATLFATLARPDRAIVGPRADMALIWGAPLWTLAFIWAFMSLAQASHFGLAAGALGFFVASMTAAHLAPVFVRSHLNPDIRRAHRLKLFIVPPLLFGALLTSHWAFVVGGVIAFFWDVYHTAQQNFGLARIYDAKAGDTKGATRTLDRLFCHVMYLGPIMAGASFFEHLKALEDFRMIGLAAFAALPQQAEGFGGAIRLFALVLMSAACVIYVAAQWRLMRRGHAVSPHKILLMTSTVAVQILAWGFAPPAVAFMAINLYHALQYFGIVWRQEGSRAAAHMGLKRPDFARPAALAVIIVAPILYGLLATAAPFQWNALGALFLSVSLLHFWMDGFIWSVRK